MSRQKEVNDYQKLHVIIKLKLVTVGYDKLFAGRSSQLYTELWQFRKESLKKIQACMGFKPLTPAIPVQCSRYQLS